MSESRHSEIINAINSARIKADADPLRPAFHFHPPSQWTNDPNGTIFVDGYYHVFYQHNPFNDWWDHMHWGHARTKDFITWEHLPIALIPDSDEKEAHCFSGCCTIAPDNTPKIFYTSVAPNRDLHPNQQRVAVGNRDLTVWQKNEEAILKITDAPDGIRYDWRDPYVFQDNGEFFLVLGSVIPHGREDRAAVLLYKAEDQDLLRWSYCSPLYIFESETTFPECPNYFRLQDRWLLIVSPCGPVRYLIGNKGDPAREFVSQNGGIVDHCSEYYATNTISDGQRVILLAWIRGFPKGRGWNGCHAIPRELAVDDENMLLQKPIQEYELLRKNGLSLNQQELSEKRIVLDEVPMWSLEIEGTVELDVKSKATITVCKDDISIFRILIDNHEQMVHTGGVPVPLRVEASKSRKLNFRLYLDRSVAELFLDDGRDCVTRIIEDLLGANRIVLETEQNANFASIKCWEILPLNYIH